MSLQGWRSHLPGQPGHEEIIPDVQPELPLTQLEALLPHPITSSLWEEADPHLCYNFPLGTQEEEDSKLSPVPPFLQAKHFSNNWSKQLQ